MHYSFKHLAYLVAVADAQSFSRAAATCNVTQSTLSLGIQELERQMNIPLFERRRGNVLPTAAGKTALTHARRLLDESRHLQEAMTLFQTGADAGPLQVGAIPTIAPYFLPRALPALEKAFPHSAIYVAEDPTEEIINRVHNGDMDLGFLAFPVDTRDLQTHILFKEDFVLAVPEGTPMPDRLHPDDLAGQDILLLRDGHCLKEHVLSACRLSADRNNRFFEAESLPTLLAMVNQGYGMTLLPEMAVRADITNPYPHVALKRFAAPAPSRQVGLVWRRTDIRARDYLNIDFQTADDVSISA